jgi:hypothetical protein
MHFALGDLGLSSRCHVFIEEVLPLYLLPLFLPLPLLVM